MSQSYRQGWSYPADAVSYARLVAVATPPQELLQAGWVPAGSSRYLSHPRFGHVAFDVQEAKRGP
jgi:hypothetical protein